MANSPSTSIIQQNDGKEVAPVEEHFPTALVKGAKTLNDVVAGWAQQWNLEAHEVTKEQTRQVVELVHDPLEGKLTMRTENLDGLHAQLVNMEALLTMPTLVMADGITSLLKYFTQGDGRPALPPGDAGVVIGYKDKQLKLDWFPKDGPTPKLSAKKLLAVTLAYLVAEGAGLPVERFLEAFGWERKEA